MRRLIAVAIAVLFGIGYVRGASAAQWAPDPEKRTVVLAALGDSITTAAGTCGPYFLCVDNSWATGTQVYSVFQRLRAARPQVNVQPVNLAVPGAGVADLSAEATAAVERKADYVTILIGANDACQWLMMSPETFGAYLGDALQVLKQGRPRARVQMVSIPDLGKLWTIAHGSPMALMMWQLKECPSLMTNATSSAAADVRMRRSVARHVNAYNRELAKACERYGNRCHWDGGRAHRVEFALEMVGFDYFHPSLRGQRELARTPLSPSWTSPVNRR